MKEARSQLRAEAVIAMILRPSRFLPQTEAAAARGLLARGIDATVVRRGRRSDAAAVPGIQRLELVEMAVVAAAVAMMTMERMVTTTVTDAAAANKAIKKN